MAKIQSRRKATLQPDVPNLIHDIILSLCQRKYSDLSDVEVDGIICISFGGLTEQQVIKIHENLPSVPKSKVDETVTNLGSNRGTVSKIAEVANKSNELDLQLEVENINGDGHEGSRGQLADDGSNLQTSIGNDAAKCDSNNYQSDISFLSSLLKTTNDLMGKEPGSTKKKGRKPRSVKPDKAGSSSRRKRKHPIHNPVRDSPKKAYTDESLNDSRAESNDFSNEQSEEINSPMVIVKQEPLDYEETNPKIVDVFSATNEESNAVNVQHESERLNERSKQELLCRNLGLRSVSVEKPLGVQRPDVDAGNINIVIKQEREDDSDYGATCDENIDSPAIASGVDINGYPDFFCMAGYSDRDYDSQENDVNENHTSLRKTRTEDKDESAASKKWFETVKRNMNKYQAALLKSVQITKKGPERNKGLKSRAQKELVDNNEEMSMLKGTHDEDIPEKDIPTDTTIKKEQFGNSESKDHDFGGAKPKLVTKYPALFSHLKKSKDTDNQTDVASQPDSLVNMLPFLSFKDLFAQASPNTSGIDMRPSPERLANLLSQPTMLSSSPSNRKKSNKHPLAGGASPARRAWNWKKRAVRPKGPNGEILTNLPPIAKNSDKPVGIANPKRKKSKSKNKDEDWYPHHANEGGRASRGVVSTRLSSGRSRRTNFTEYSDSDIEEIDTEQDHTNNIIIETEEGDPIQMISAYCKYNCGARFDSVEELGIHEESCSQKGFQCEFCGLDFNQQYRWQYHMIKVHGISVDSTMFK